MAQNVREVMTQSVVALSNTTSLITAARAMRDSNIGDVIVLDRDVICGIVTDRDIVVRGIAENRDVTSTRLADVCSKNLVTLNPDDSVDDALRLMKEKALRRLPVVEGGRAVGIVSIGDLAVEREPASVLGNISKAPPNR